ncbi:hypothetical protein [Burkholderia stagnalis]|uniref:hypothetical protein n=1 Tax=Burkholderia stagnalis TaxID=1503054 RepID=UPI000AB1992C|nr:hypothetical protein [Burkholderia stagnalis]
MPIKRPEITDAPRYGLCGVPLFEINDGTRPIRLASTNIVGTAMTTTPSRPTQRSL